MKTAFADIAVTWHQEHETASLSQFLRRVHTISKHITDGDSLFDVHNVHMQLVRAEKRSSRRSVL